MNPLENESSPISPMHPQTASEDGESPRASTNVTGPIESVIRQIGIDKVYGTPITQGDTTVVPVAELRTGFGFGSGHDSAGGEEGGGGGAGLRLTPRGYIHITTDGVEYRPIYDLRTFVVGGAFLGWLLYRLLAQ